MNRKNLSISLSLFITAIFFTFCVYFGYVNNKFNYEYFRNNSIYDARIMPDTVSGDSSKLKEIKNIIIKYPKLFSQYYTYDSAVKNKFCRFDYFIELLNTMSDFYYNTLCILLNVYSLEELYYRMDEILKKFFDIYRSIDYIDRTVDKSKYLLPKINDLITDYLEKEEVPNESEDIYFASLSYDESKLNFFLGDKIEDVKMFKFNVQKLLKDKVYVKEDYYIKLYKIGKNVKVKHIIKKESD